MPAPNPPSAAVHGGLVGSSPLERLRQVECLVRDSYFTPRPINLYFACATHIRRPQLLATRS